MLEPRRLSDYEIMESTAYLGKRRRASGLIFPKKNKKNRGILKEGRNRD